MKKLTNTTFIVMLLTFGATNIFAQTSDYQIKKDFEATYAELKASVNEAMTVNEIDSVRDEIRSFASKNEKHEQLLDNALYPDSFEKSIEELKQLVRNNEHKLLIIENQDERLGKLADELSSYKSEIANLNSKRDSLRNAILTSEQSESELSRLVERYRTNLQERDELVLHMIDSLFISYKDMQGNSLADFPTESGAKKFHQDNPLELIQSIIDENIQILKAKDDSFKTEDYLRMYVVQSRFNEVWNKIGDDLSKAYGGTNSEQWKASVESKLVDWKSSASKNMWASIDESLDENNVSLDAFDNNESFYSAIDNFISNATDASRDKVVTSENYEDFQAFYDFWNGKIKKEWGTFVEEGEVLTMQQISTIDSEIMNWRDEAKPKAFLIPILFGVSLLTIVGLIIVLARK